MCRAKKKVAKTPSQDSKSSPTRGKKKKEKKRVEEHGNGPPSSVAPETEPNLICQTDDWSEENEAVDISLGESMKSTRSAKKKRGVFDKAPEFLYAQAFCKLGIEALVKEFFELRNYETPGATYNEFNQNKANNRYADVPCLDAPPEEKILKDSYYHGNLVYFPQDQNPRFARFLICSGPLAHTTNTFYEVVKVHGITSIVMLCDWNENGKPKCHNYLPQNEEAARLCDMSVPIVIEEKDAPAQATISQCQLKGLGITHIRWTGWPDHCAPTSTKPVFQILELAKKYNKDKQKPVLVHCSAGIGRSGTLIALDLLQEHFKNFDGKTKISDMLKYLRKYRAKIIQTAPQYVFLHIAFLDLLVQKYGPEVETSKMKTFRVRYIKYAKIVSQKEHIQPKPLSNSKQGPNMK